ncbi:MAG: TetR/AcrR family transcriptional regulator [Lewinellaceae bacterium]|jgi:AcrR family transcriptional regulator|nr:TetR/AcrR family transcriptional regulator [Lewinellaceae bacterium]
MNTLTTKQKILEASIRLFNWNDVANVRLQQIADETGISVGNLAYHFKNKEAIVNAVYENLFDEFSQILSAYLISPKLTDFDMQMEQYHRFFSKYKFYLIDLFEIERSYPAIMERWRECIGKMLLQIRKRLDYYVNRGILRPEPAPGVYDTLSNNIWATIVFWAPQQILKDKPLNESAFKQTAWAHISPYFTPKGLDEFALEVQPMMLS